MLKNKVVLVTGAASGIGRAIALVAAREGARLVLSDVDAHAGQETLKQIRALGAEVLLPTSVNLTLLATTPASVAPAHCSLITRSMPGRR